MGSITIRHRDETAVEQLRLGAASQGRIVEEEAEANVRSVLSPLEPGERNPAQSIRQYVERFGGVELEIPPREPMRPPPDCFR